MTRLRPLAILILLSSWLLPIRGVAECTSPLVPEDKAFDTVLKPILADITTDEMPALSAMGVRETPDVRPTTVQIAAPSTTNSSSASLADGADSSSFLGLALDSGILQSENGKLTLNLNAFGLRTIFNHNLWTDQEEYQKHSLARRFSVSVSSGGKGESFDRNGDGMVDEALDAKNLNDIVTYEGRIRLSRSRDRREQYNWTEFTKSTTGALEQVGSLETAILSRLQALSSYPWEEDDQGRKLACVNPERLKQLVDTPRVRDLLADLLPELARTESLLAKSWEEAAQAVSRRLVYSLAVGGVKRGTEFGPDQIFVALRGDKPLRKDQTLKFNAQWTQIDSQESGEQNPEMVKLSAEWGTLWKSLLAKDGVVVSFAASWEDFHNVADAKFGTISKVGAKLELPVAEGLTLPISVTWANHRDLFTDEDEIVGHFALSYDLSKFLKFEGTSSKGGT